jgi:hypothetical protein
MMFFVVSQTNGKGVGKHMAQSATTVPAAAAAVTDVIGRRAGVSFGVARPSSFGGEMNNERISQRLEHQIERINAKLESTRNPARRKQLRERKWALKSRLRGSS